MTPLPDHCHRPDRTEAVGLLLDCAALPAALDCPPWQAAGLVAAEDVSAPLGVPEQAVSLRDGFALRAEDTAPARTDKPLTLTISGTLTAESRHASPLEPGNAARILTGAPLPPGADAVAPLESVGMPPGGADIELREQVRPGSFVLPRGGDLPAGSLLARRGERLAPQTVAVLTRARAERMAVHARPAVAVFGLGSELAEPQVSGDPERIPADNPVLVSGLLRAWGAEVVRCGVLPDDAATVRTALDNAVQATPRPVLIVTTGGTGRSERDHARAAAGAAGFHTLFHGLDVRPGRNAFAALRKNPGKENVLLLGLPGPPAAVFACLHALARPLVRRLAGSGGQDENTALLDRDLTTRNGPEWLLPCALRLENGALLAEPLHGDAWPSLFALSRARGVACLAPGKHYRKGDRITLLGATGLPTGL